jgi:hypothetical protein
VAATQVARRKVVVDEFADGILSQQDIEAAALAEREAQLKSTEDKRRQQLQTARADVDCYSAIVDEMETALDLFETLEKERATVAARLLRVSGLAGFLATPSWTRRLGDHLSRRLFGLYRTNNLGRIALNAGGNYITSSLAGAERASLTRLLDHQMNGEDHGI